MLGTHEEALVFQGACTLLASNKDVMDDVGIDSQIYTAISLSKRVLDSVTKRIKADEAQAKKMQADGVKL